MAQNSLESLKKDLVGIKETEESLPTISAALAHVRALESILKVESVDKKPRVTTFSTVSLDELQMAGVQRGLLNFVASEITNLPKMLTMDAKAQIVDLHSRIKDIYACVNMDYERGSRMILDAILLMVQKIASTPQRDVAIIPEMRFGQGDEVKLQIAHPDTRCASELWLSGTIDYAVIEYEKRKKARLVGPGGSREGSLRFAKSHLLLVQAKHLSLGRSFIECIPEAVGQAIALLMSDESPLLEVRFCLSDGQAWIFFILKMENYTLTYYESEIHYLKKECIEAFEPLCELVQLLCQWLRPTVNGLFELEN